MKRFQRFVVLLGLIIVILVLTTDVSVADKAPQEVPFLRSSRDGQYYFKMLPAGKQLGAKARGEMYRLNSDGTSTRIWTTEGWYSQRIFVVQWGAASKLDVLSPILIRIENRHEFDKPSSDHLAVSFYRKGKMFKSYSTKELIKDPSRLLVTPGAYYWLATEPSELGEGEINPRVYQSLESLLPVLYIKTKDQRELRFNCLNGELIPSGKVKGRLY